MAKRTAPNVKSALMTERTLKDLVAAKLVDSISARAKGAAFEVIVRFGDVERVLGSSRGSNKVYASLDTVALQLLRLGIESFTVQAANYAPGRVRAARPDRSTALKEATKKTKKVAS